MFVIELCPKGDDPLTPITQRSNISVTTSAIWGNITDGAFLLSFNGRSFSFPASPTAWSLQACSEAFSNLLNVGRATCSGSVINRSFGTTYNVVFESFPSVTYENNIYSFNGTLSPSSFGCALLWTSNTSQGMECAVTVHHNANLTYPGSSQ